MNKMSLLQEAISDNKTDLGPDSYIFTMVFVFISSTSLIAPVLD